MSDIQIMSARALASGYLCKRCNCNQGLTEDGAVLCAKAEMPVRPIKKKIVRRFDECPYRLMPFETGQLGQVQLRQLAAYARSGPHSREDIDNFEQSLRSGQSSPDNQM